jgi:uncharacterized membrane protein YsdA (DUF1294 family)
MQEFNLFIIGFLLAANCLSFIVVGLDKHKSTTESSRIPEVYLFFWGLFFSSLGVLLGMFVFRHKVKKLYFTIGINLMLIQQALLIYLLYTRN